MFKSWRKASVQAAGYRGITQEHIEKVAQELLKTGLTHIDSAAFHRACLRCGINGATFTPEDLKKLEERLNR